MNIKKKGLFVFAIASIIGSLLTITLYSPLTFSKQLRKQEVKSMNTPENEIVHRFGNYFRKLIKINSDGSYVIQDFYSADNKPYSNQYIIQKKEDLKKETDEQTSINGQYVYFDSYGRTLTINYKNGKKEGLSVKAFKEGKKIEEMAYRDNLLNGKYVSWWRNGNKKAEGNFVNGKEEGTNTLWYKNGQKSFVGSMKDGKIEGAFSAWHENGQKQIDGNAVAGKEHGKLVSWYENGQKSSELFLEHGEIKKCSQFDENEKVIYSEETSSEVCQKVYQSFYTMTLESEDPE